MIPQSYSGNNRHELSVVDALSRLTIIDNAGDSITFTIRRDTLTSWDNQSLDSYIRIFSPKGVKSESVEAHLVNFSYTLLTHDHTFLSHRDADVVWVGPATKTDTKMLVSLISGISRQRYPNMTELTIDLRDNTIEASHPTRED